MTSSHDVMLLNRLLRLFGLLLLVYACCGTSQAQQRENRVALVIGNSAYKQVPLRNPSNDARDMAARLRSLGFSVIERDNLQIRQIGSTLREFRSKLTPGSVALVFYAGHGLQIKGENYLPAVDADIVSEDDVPQQSLATRQIMDVLADAKTRLNLLFLDACRDNPYSRSFRSASRGLSRENAPSGTLMSFATRPGGVAADGLGRNGVYTAALLRAMSDPNRPIEQVLKTVITTVMTDSRNQQEPWMEGSFSGEFCFGKCPSLDQAAVSDDRALWDAVKDSRDINDFRAYLEKFPRGLFSEVAGNRIRSMTQTASIALPTYSGTGPASVIVSGTRCEDCWDGVVRIGHVAPLTGAIWHLGKDNENGARMAIDELNAKGVTIGGKRVKLELVTEDDAADPRQGIAVAQRLVEKNVSGVIGHLNSGTSIPASIIYSNAGIPQISPSATNPKFTRQGLKTTFRVVADDVHLGGMLGSFAVKDLKAKTVAIIDDRTAYGQGVADEFEKAAKAAGANIAGREFTTSRSTNFAVILSRIKTTQPDLIFFGGMDDVAGPMLREMRAIGLNARFMGGDGICTSGLAKLAGDAMADGQVVCGESGGVQGAEVELLTTFNAKFKAKYNADVQVYAPYVYDAVNVMVAAMVKANSADPKVYLPVLAKTTGHKGVTGTISFDPKGDIKNGARTLYTYKAGKRDVIAVVR